MQEVENALNGQAEAANNSKKNKPISLRLSPEQREAVKAAADRAGMTMTDYIKARLFAMPTRDRTKLALINGLHVGGLALLAMLDRAREEAELRTKAENVVEEMRYLVEQLAADIR